MEISLHTETIDEAYTSSIAFCADYYALGVDVIEETVASSYINAMMQSDELVSIEALCAPVNSSNTKTRALFSIRFAAYGSSLFSRDKYQTLLTIQEDVQALFTRKISSGNWTANRLAVAATSAGRRLDENIAAKAYISPQTVLGFETVILETLNPSIGPTFSLTSEPTSTPLSTLTLEPTSTPTPRPTSAPTRVPISQPTLPPTSVPTSRPTSALTPPPTSVPTLRPTFAPNSVPTSSPTSAPIPMPTSRPTSQPTSSPTPRPTVRPTPQPSVVPGNPSASPVTRPTLNPSTTAPTLKPSTAAPSPSPTITPCVVLRSRGEVPVEPELVSAAFSATGAELKIRFDVATDQAGFAAGVAFACSEVLDFADVESADCMWSGTASLRAEVSAALDLTPGGTVSLRVGVLKRRCDDTSSRCDCYLSANASSTSVLPPDPALLPESILIGDTTISTCEDLEVDSALSTGSGGREFERYRWSVETDPALGLLVANETNLTVAAVAAYERALDRSNSGGDVANDGTPRGRGVFTASSAELSALEAVGVRRLLMRLNLTNFLLGVDDSEVFPVEIRTDTPPNVELVGGVRQAVTRKRALSVKANAIATGCDGRPAAGRGVSYEWWLYKDVSGGGLVDTGLHSTSKDPALYSLPSYSLEASAEYVLAVTGTDLVLGLNATTAVVLTVARSAVVALIAGGDRALSILQVVVLSAAGSYDEDVEFESGEAAGLSFKWSCAPACGAIEIASRETFEFDGAQLGTGTFGFDVVVTSTDNRSSAASVAYELINDDPPAVSIDASALGPRVSSSARVVLYGTALPSSTGRDVLPELRFDTEWSLTAGELVDSFALDEWTRTDTSVSGGAASRKHDLVLAAGALVGGSTYTLKLEAALDGATAMGRASVSFYAAPQPTSGVLSIVPAQGYALETEFTLRTSNWVTEDSPLRYAYEAIVVAEGVARTSVLRAATLQYDLVGVVFSAGSVVVVVVAYDLLGGSSRASRTILVEPTTLSGAALANLTNVKLATAFALGSPDAVCQAVVASSQAARNDSGLIDTLVSSVAAVTGNQDADSSLVARTSAALDAATAHPHALGTSTASIALDTANALASQSYDAGIDARAVGAIGSVLSSLLTSSLFADDARRALRNSSDVNATSVVLPPGVLGKTLGGVAAAQLRKSVVGEYALSLSAVNLRMSAQRLSPQGVGRALTPPDSDSSAALPDSFGDESDYYDVYFAEVDVNQFRAIDGDNAATSKNVRFGLSSTSNNTHTVRVEFIIDSGDDAELASNYSSQPASAILSCECESYDPVSFVCPSGRVLNVTCDGHPGVFNVTCPSLETACARWDSNAGAWSADCEAVVVVGLTTTTCVCDVSLDGESADYSTTADYGASLSAYSKNLTSATDLGRALYMIVALLATIAMCACCSLYGRILDARDAQLDKNAASLGLSVVEHEYAVIVAPWTSRIMSGLRRIHPLVNWYCLYSESNTRAKRAWYIGVEILLILFVTAFGTDIQWPDPGCGDELTLDDCLAWTHVVKGDIDVRFSPSFAVTFHGAKMCVWDACADECSPVIPQDDAQNSTSYYLFLGCMLVLTLPLIKAFSFIYENYLIAPVPPELKSFWRTAEGGGAPPQPDLPKLSTEHFDAPPLNDKIHAVDAELNTPSEQVPREMAVSPSLSSWSSRSNTLAGEPLPEDDAGSLSNLRPITLALEDVSTDNAGQHAEVAATRTSAHFIAVDSVDTVERTEGLADIFLELCTDKLDGDGMLDLSKFEEQEELTEGEVILNIGFGEGDDEPTQEEARDGWAEGLSISMQESTASWISSETPTATPRKGKRHQLLRLGTCHSRLPRAFSYGQKQDEATILAPTVADAVEARLRQLHTLGVEAKARGGSRGRHAVRMLQELEVHLEEQWKWVPDRALFVQNVAAVVRNQLRMALTWEAQLEEDGDDDDETRYCKKLRQFEHFVSHEHCSPSEFKILEAMLSRFDDSLDAPDEPPPLLQYLAAWTLALGMIGYCLWYLLGASDRMGLKTSAAWLATAALSLMFNYVIISPFMTAIFYVVVPGTIRETVRRCIDPSTIRRFPYTARCPSSASYYILQRHLELLGTPIAEFVLGETIEAHVTAEIFDRELECIWSDTLSSTDQNVLKRIVTVTLSVLVNLDEDVQDVILAEFMAFMPLIAQLGNAELSRGSTGRASRGNTGFLVVFTLSLLVLAIIWTVIKIAAFSSNFVYSKPARAKVYRKVSKRLSSAATLGRTKAATGS